MTQKIDYSKLTDRIVEQAIEQMGYHLTEDAFKKLIQLKSDRAQAMIEARKNIPCFHTER